MLEFNSDNHVYRRNGQIIPSVTQILGGWWEVEISGRDYYLNVLTGSIIAADKMKTAADHGTAVHKACWLILKHGHDGLDWGVLDPELIHPLQQLEKWQEDWKPTVILLEQPMYSDKYGYAGTPDIVALILNQATIPAVIDIKTGAYDMAGPQVAAYEQLFKEHDKFRGTVRRYVLHLPKTGSYKFVPLTDKRDWDFFRSRLFQYNYLNS